MGVAMGYIPPSVITDIQRFTSHKFNNRHSCTEKSEQFVSRFSVIKQKRCAARGGSENELTNFLKQYKATFLPKRWLTSVKFCFSCMLNI